MTQNITIKVKCFSRVKQVFNKDQFTLSLAFGSTTETAMNTIREMANGELEKIPMRVAVNHKYAPETVPLKDGDEVALIPPVQGG